MRYHFPSIILVETEKSVKSSVREVSYYIQFQGSKKCKSLWKAITHSSIPFLELYTQRSSYICALGDMCKNVHSSLFCNRKTKQNIHQQKDECFVVYSRVRHSNKHECPAVTHNNMEEFQKQWSMETNKQKNMYNDSIHKEFRITKSKKYVLAYIHENSSTT